jgi:farnesyl-diphosphate farnesyltransferase
MLGPMLREVSRSFYVTLRVLPASVRPQISLAYLLARMTDTIADTQLLPTDERLAALADLRDRIIGSSTAPLLLAEFAKNQGSHSERVLLQNCESALQLLRESAAGDRELIVGVLTTIVSGQELDLKRFGSASADNIAALASAADLDDYTYRVAGCVGEFWTRICQAHIFTRDNMDTAFLLGNGIRFGKGLQLVNILRDIPGDLRTGRCYLPLEELSAVGLSPTDLLHLSNEGRLRPIYDRWLECGQAHLDAGWAYTTALPRKSVRIRLACAWPLLLGARTLQLLRTGSVLDARCRIKVPRAELRGMMWRSVLFYPFRRKWEGLYQGGTRRLSTPPNGICTN